MKKGKIRKDDPYESSKIALFYFLLYIKDMEMRKNPFTKGSRAEMERAIAITEANERCTTWMQDLENALELVRKDSKNSIKIEELKKQVTECTTWKILGRNIFADNKNELKERAIEIQKEFGFTY